MRRQAWAYLMVNVKVHENQKEDATDMVSKNEMVCILWVRNDHNVLDFNGQSNTLASQDLSAVRTKICKPYTLKAV